MKVQVLASDWHTSSCCLWLLQRMTMWRVSMTQPGFRWRDRHVQDHILQPAMGSGPSGRFPLVFIRPVGSLNARCWLARRGRPEHVILLFNICMRDTTCLPYRSTLIWHRMDTELIRHRGPDCMYYYIIIIIILSCYCRVEDRALCDT